MKSKKGPRKELPPSDPSVDVPAVEMDSEVVTEAAATTIPQLNQQPTTATERMPMPTKTNAPTPRIGHPRNHQFKRIDSRHTPSRNYNQVQAEMYGSGCKGKKFRKEKGKKKRSQYSGAKIDGSVKSVRLDV